MKYSFSQDTGLFQPFVGYDTTVRFLRVTYHIVISEEFQDGIFLSVVIVKGLYKIVTLSNH